MLHIAAVVACLIGQPEPRPGVPMAAMAPPPGQTAWIKDHAIALKTVEAGQGFEDLEPLRAIIGDARVVALGEPTHGTREAFQMKHRLVEFLATKLGFTVFSIEANMPESYAVDEYVSHGSGDPESLISGMYFWTWRTEEVADMVRWMRKFNEAGAGHVKFTGFDMQTPDVAGGIALEFLNKADAEYAGVARGAYAAASAAKEAEESAFGVATGAYPAERAAGKHLTFSGWIKTKDLANGFAGLWWRADGKDGVLAFDNMQGRGPSGTTDWTAYAIELDVPAETTNINFGVIMPGKGMAWFDDLKIELDGKDGGDPALFDLGFEGEAIKGFFTPRGGYEAVLDRDVKHGGAQSLRLESAAKAGAKAGHNGGVEGPIPAAAAKLARDVLEHMESSREAYLKVATAEETDWVIQNARVVAQCYKMRAGNSFRVRDESMAANVKWILNHSAPGTKIVLWAHNGHVNRQAGCMGSFLGRAFGKDLVVIGFAAGSGRYTAVGDQGLGGHDLAAPPGGSFEWRCAATGLPRFILPTRGATPEDRASAWLTEPIQIRSIGAMAMDQQFATQDLSIAYDAVVYLGETTEARQLPR